MENSQPSPVSSPTRFTTIKRHISSFLILYVVVVGLMYVFQRKLMYPAPFEVSTPEQAAEAGLQVITIETENGQTIQGWFVPPSHANKPVVAFFHGNGGLLRLRAGWAKARATEGYGVFLVGYRGYDGAPGETTEQGLYVDARAQLHWLEQQGYSGHRLVLQAESLGTGVAVQMATEFQIGAVILESPYADLVDVGEFRYPFAPIRWLQEDRFDSASKIANIHAPLLIIHGTEDSVVPFYSAQRLFAAAVEPKEAHWLEGANHFTILAHGAGPIIAQFLARLYP
jgi:fermentation-respiration switch protein FrsA (DUF1100 family)